jgi:hypothetical protein
MIVPTKIKISGTTYTIEPVSQLRADDDCSGRALFTRGVIQLDDSMCADIANATLLHEVIEIINEENELKMSHRVIQSLATQIYGVVKDNMEMFKND